ncbi:MAG: ATP-binding protein, partial [Sphingomonas sp.]
MSGAPPRRAKRPAKRPAGGTAEASTAAYVERILALSAEERAELLRGLSAPQRRTLNDAWFLWAHPGQLAPPGDWRVWLIRAGRGFGKTRAGAEWVSEIARSMPGARIALVGATIDD